MKRHLNHSGVLTLTVWLSGEKSSSSILNISEAGLFDILCVVDVLLNLLNELCNKIRADWISNVRLGLKPY